MATQQRSGKVKVHSREGEIGETTGGSRACNTESCKGRRLAVRWEDGKITYPCTSGMAMEDDRSWRIRGA